MIARQTIFSLLLALLVGVGLKGWAIEHADGCTPFLAGDQTAPSTQTVLISRTETIEIPCKLWLPRQSVRVQVFCLLELALILIFVVSGVGDLARRIHLRRSGRRL